LSDQQSSSSAQCQGRPPMCMATIYEMIVTSNVALGYPGLSEIIVQ